jgi:hypothetical protein
VNSLAAAGNYSVATLNLSDEDWHRLFPGDW